MGTKKEEIMARPGITTYHKCKCGELVIVPKGESVTCKCEKVFGVQASESSVFKTPYIGKNPWTRTTKIEFSETTMDQDIADRNKR